MAFRAGWDRAVGGMCQWPRVALCFPSCGRNPGHGKPTCSARESDLGEGGGTPGQARHRLAQCPEKAPAYHRPIRCGVLCREVARCPGRAKPPVQLEHRECRGAASTAAPSASGLSVRLCSGRSASRDSAGECDGRKKRSGSKARNSAGTHCTVAPLAIASIQCAGKSPRRCRRAPHRL